VLTLIPAYGRDYKSRKALLADWQGGKDFIIACYGHRYDTKPCNRESMFQAGESEVQVRYGKMRKVAVIKVTDSAIGG